nr:MAG TPA: hypothetical protein [Caudoviricetes sp.]
MPSVDVCYLTSIRNANTVPNTSTTYPLTPPVARYGLQVAWVYAVNFVYSLPTVVRISYCLLGIPPRKDYEMQCRQ